MEQEGNMFFERFSLQNLSTVRFSEAHKHMLSGKNTEPHTPPVSITLVLSLNRVDRDTAENHSCAEGDLVHFHSGSVWAANVSLCVSEGCLFSANFRWQTAAEGAMNEILSPEFLSLLCSAAVLIVIVSLPYNAEASKDLLVCM